MEEQATLDSLLVDEKEINESLLTETLAPYVQIGENSGAFIPTEEFESLSATAQTTVVLLYQKAAYELDLAEEEGATPTDIAESSGVNHSTVKTSVRKLAERNLVVNEAGEYSIPTYNYDSARDLIEGE